MSVYAGNRYFECDGDNYAPDELVDLLYAIHEVGLPLIWNNRGIVMPNAFEWLAKGGRCGLRRPPVHSRFAKMSANDTLGGEKSY